MSICIKRMVITKCVVCTSPTMLIGNWSVSVVSVMGDLGALHETHRMSFCLQSMDAECYVLPCRP
jgi:hypothetical protein